MVDQSSQPTFAYKVTRQNRSSRPNKGVPIKTGSIEFSGAESDDPWNEQPGHRSTKANYTNYKESARISRQPKGETAH